MLLYALRVEKVQKSILKGFLSYYLKRSILLAPAQNGRHWHAMHVYPFLRPGDAPQVESLLTLEADEAL